MGSLGKMIAKRLASGVIVLFIISVLIFLGVEALPGDLAQSILGQSATPETVAAIRRELGLNLPPHVRYLEWMSGLLHGDLGVSLANRRPIVELISDRLKNTLLLAAMAATIAVPFAVALGMLAALYRERLFDKMISMVTLMAISVPEFLIAYILITILAVQFNVFPAISTVSPHDSFFSRLHTIALPALTLTLAVVAHMMRMTRAAILSVMSSPYIEMARLKGIKSSRIITHHAFPNALSPIINVIVVNLAYLVIGVVVVEVVFAYPGLGQLLVESVSKRDVPVVQATCLIFSVTYVLLNLFADILAIISNPRLRHPK